MKRILLFFLFIFSTIKVNSQINVVPDTLAIGSTTEVVFSGSGIGFSQGTCIYVFLVQGTDFVIQNASSTYQAGSDILTASFTLATSILNGLWDVYIVDICDASWMGDPIYSPGAVLTVVSDKMTAGPKAGIKKLVSYFETILFPNPVKKGETFTISSSNSKSIKNQMIIRDLQGKSIYTAEYRGDKKDINTSNLSSGTYFVEIYNDKGEKSSNKIVVE